MMKGMGGWFQHFAWMAAMGAALGADINPREIVRQALVNDERPAADYSFMERLRTSNLGGGAVSTRTRQMHLADYERRREKFRKALREIPDAFIFRLVGEENVNSRPAYVIEATPRPGYQPVDRYSRLFTQLRGKLWIDKSDCRWAKIEAELLDTVTFGWILVRIHEGSRVRMSQQRMDDGAWVPDQMWYRISMRVGLVKLLGAETEVTYGDYRLSSSTETLQAP